MKKFPGTILAVCLCVAATISCWPQVARDFAASAKAAAGQPTFERDIAPLIYRNCASCHHVNGAGPFPLMSYLDVKQHGHQIVAMTKARLMPPWLPDPGYGDFKGGRRLTNSEISMLQRWVSNRMPEGAADSNRAPPQFGDDWQLGKPDLVLTMPQAFTLPARVAAGGDVFRNFVLRVPLTAPRYVRAIELHPGPSKVFHHANILIDRSGWSRKRDGQDGQPGFPGMELYIQSDRFDPDSQFLFWKPGSPPTAAERDMAWRIDPGTDLVLNMHMRPSGKTEKIQASVGIYFTELQPTKFPLLIQLENDHAIDIPAGDRNFVVQDQFRLPTDVQILAVYPHAHYLGKDIKAFAVLPSGERRWLIWIHDWNFDWQGVFTYRQPVYLPRGSIVHMQWTYDNSDANPRNPHQPPQRVTAGDQATDEMAHFWLQVLPVHWKDPHTDGRLVLQAAMMRHRVESDPDDYVGHFNLAADLQLLGRAAEATEEYRRAVALRPEDPVAHNGLGSALEDAGDRDNALAEYRRAVQLDPENSDANYNLGRALATKGEYETAVDYFRAVLRSKPADAAAYNALANALLSAGDRAGAVQSYLTAIRLDSKLADAHYNLGLLLAEANDLSDAEEHLREAVRLTPTSADAHMHLGDVLARKGKLDTAEVELKRALALAPSHADALTDLAIIDAKRGDLTRAEAELRRAIASDPGNVAARQNLQAIIVAKKSLGKP
jgi:Flp pilus assembly protein TadD/mono/diheme cytochrome c family protein